MSVEEAKELFQEAVQACLRGDTATVLKNARKLSAAGWTKEKVKQHMPEYASVGGYHG